MCTFLGLRYAFPPWSKGLYERLLHFIPYVRKSNSNFFLPVLMTSATRCFFPLGTGGRGAAGGRSKVSK